MLARSAAATGVAWATPMLVSSPAFAATDQCSGSRPCSKYYFVGFSSSGSTGEVPSGSGGNCQPVPIEDLRCQGDTKATFAGDGQPLLDDIGTWFFTLKPGRIPVFVEVKYATNCNRYRLIGSSFVADGAFTGSGSTPTPTHPQAAHVELGGTAVDGFTITISKLTGQGISNIGMYFCD